MKKAISILVFCLVLVAALCAVTTNRYTKYGNIFKTGEYTLKATAYDLDAKGNRTGSGSPMTIAGHAGWYFIEAEDGGQTMRVVVRDGKVYMISDSEKSIMVMTFEGMDDLDVVEMPHSIDTTSSGTGKLDGKSYYYEKATDTDGLPVTYWFSGNELYAIQSESTVIYITSITQKADASLFDIPTGYQVYDMSDLSSLFSDSSWDSSWDSDYDWDWDFSGDSEDFDWSSIFGDLDWSGDWGLYDIPHYYALGILLGLNSKQARDFEDSMTALSGFDWDSLNDYYDAENDRYNLGGMKLDDIVYMDKADIELVKKMVERFKR